MPKENGILLLWTLFFVILQIDPTWFDDECFTVYAFLVFSLSSIFRNHRVSLLHVSLYNIDDTVHAMIHRGWGHGVWTPPPLENHAIICPPAKRH